MIPRVVQEQRRESRPEHPERQDRESRGPERRCAGCGRSFVALHDRDRCCRLSCIRLAAERERPAEAARLW